MSVSSGVEQLGIPESHYLNGFIGLKHCYISTESDNEDQQVKKATTRYFMQQEHKIPQPLHKITLNSASILYTIILPKDLPSLFPQRRKQNQLHIKVMIFPPRF